MVTLNSTSRLACSVIVKIRKKNGSDGSSVVSVAVLAPRSYRLLHERDNTVFDCCCPPRVYVDPFLAQRSLEFWKCVVSVSNSMPKPA